MIDRKSFLVVLESLSWARGSEGKSAADVGSI